MGGLAAVGEQQYSLRWNDFHSSILSSFRHLRDEEDFVDVTLACDGRSFSAHKVVLSACSPYFRRLLKANPCTHPIVILRDVREQDMAALLRFMYNGEVHVGHDQLPDFLKTAQTLQVRGLADVPSKESRLPPALNDSLAWPAASDEQSSREDANQSPPPKRSRTEHRERDSSREHRDRDRERDRDRDRDRDREREQDTDRERDRSPGRTPQLNDISNAEQHSLLGQALEGGVTQGKKQSDSPAHALSTHSTGEDDEDSNSGSDTGMSERGDMVLPKSEPTEYSMDDNNGPHGNGSLSIDPHRSPNFPAALLGLQGLPGLLPGPSGLHGGQDTNFVSRRSLDLMRVRATDPRPCPKCGKIYRSAHTLRTHLEDKHTICPGYRCVLCGTVAKSRNSLHSHMSRQHRGISTKDLPVLPMPSPFDPDLASRLLAKAGVKVSPAELRARSSPTGPPRRSDIRLDLKMDSNMSNMRYSGGGVVGNRAPSEAGSIGGHGGMHLEDPEDLTLPNSRSPPEALARISLSSGGAPGATPPSPLHGPVMAAKSAEAASVGSRRHGPPEPLSAPSIGGGGGAATPAFAGSPLLDTYLQLIAESQSNLQLNLAERTKLAAELRRRNNNDFPIHPAALGLGMGQGLGSGHGQGGLTIRAHPANDLDNDMDADVASSDGEGDPDHDGQADTGAEYSEEEPEPITAE